MLYFLYILTMNWTDYFINIAEQVKEKSKDINTKIGTVIVGKDKEILSTGYNSFPRGLNDELDERQERPEKYFWFEHGERNAIYNAAENGVSLKDSTIYVIGLPICHDCAKGLIQAGISRVVTPEQEIPENWQDSITTSISMFKEAGVIWDWIK